MYIFALFAGRMAVKVFILSVVCIYFSFYTSIRRIVSSVWLGIMRHRNCHYYYYYYLDKEHTLAGSKTPLLETGRLPEGAVPVCVVPRAQEATV